jgi:hypothetical protein
MTAWVGILLLISSMAAGGEIAWRIEVEPGSLEIIHSPSGDIPVLEEGFLCTGPGMPALPGIPLSFLLPPGSRLDSVTVIELASVPLPELGEPAIVRIADETRLGFPLYPPPTGTMTSPPVTGTMTGFTVASFAFMPVRAGSLPGSSRLVTSAGLRLHFSPGEVTRALPGLSCGQLDAARRCLEVTVENPWMTSVWSPPERESPRDLISWVVIADESLEGLLQPLVDHRSSRGEAASFISTQWIESSYPGFDAQERLRNCLKDLYWNSGLVFALIVGDSGPTARTSSFIWSGVEPMNTFTDLYYSDLDGSWDGNGNHLYGEVDDGMDYYADIHVGRLPSDDPMEVSIMVSRILDYEEQPPDGTWRTTAILCGTGIVPGLSIWGSEICLEVWEGFPSDWTPVEWFEDSTGIEPQHPGSLVAPLNDGCSYLEIASHGSPEEVGWYYPPHELLSASDAMELQNGSMTPVVHSLACSVGNIDQECLAEALMTAPDGGAVAVVMNSNAGLLFTTRQGPSELMDIYYPEILLEQELDVLGLAHSISRHWLIATQGLSYEAQWVLQTLNFFGDPATRMIDPSTGIGGTAPWGSMQTTLTLFPNPAHSACRVSWSGLPQSGDAAITILDIAGRTVRSWSGIGSGEEGILLDLVDDSASTLPAGCYFVVLQCQGITATEVLVKI